MEFIWPVFTYLLFGVVGALLGFDHLKKTDQEDGITISDLIVFVLLWPFILVAMLVKGLLP